MQELRKFLTVRLRLMVEFDPNTNEIKIGSNAGNTEQGEYAVAIGYSAGSTGQGENAIAIGLSAARFSQGENAIAIGSNAGFTSQPANTIILNATGAQLNGVLGQTGCFYVAPIRVVPSSEGLYSLFYDTTTNEIVAVENITPGGPTIPL
jgi:hypothetical protein